MAKTKTASKIHIGQLIKAKVDEQGMTVVAFAAKINKASQSAHYLFTTESIDTETLVTICKVLKYDFFKHYSQATGLNSNKKEGVARKITVSIEVDSLEKQEQILKTVGITLK